MKIMFLFILIILFLLWSVLFFIIFFPLDINLYKESLKLNPVEYSSYFPETLYDYCVFKYWVTSVWHNQYGVRE